MKRRMFELTAVLFIGASVIPADATAQTAFVLPDVFADFDPTDDVNAAVLGLLPLLWESGVSADVSARTAAPVVAGLWSCMFLTLLVLPAAYTMWRRQQVRASLAAHQPLAALMPSEGAV
jgi:hypothetical protein